MVTLAVVVCSRDRPRQLGECLEAMVGQDADEVLVVDSASGSDATTVVAADHGVRWIRVEEPGLSRARNAAIRETTADVIAFTDDDCTPAADWASAIRTRFTRSLADGEKVGFVTGRVLAKGDGQPLSVSQAVLPRLVTKGDDLSEVGHGANLSVSRKCWLDIGSFDELLGVGAELRSGEDIDFIWRALEQDWVGHYEPGSEVHHEQWRGRAGVLRTQYGYGMGAGALGSKMRRLGGRAASQMFPAGTLRNDARYAARCMRNGYSFGVAQHAVHAAGVAIGRTRAGRLEIVDGRLAQR